MKLGSLKFDQHKVNQVGYFLFGIFFRIALQLFYSFTREVFFDRLTCLKLKKTFYVKNTFKNLLKTTN